MDWAPVCLTFRFIANGRAIPRMLRFPTTGHVNSEPRPEHTDLSASKCRSGVRPSAVVNTCLRICSSRTAMPVARLLTASHASRCSSEILSDSRASSTRPCTALDLPLTLTAGILVGASNSDTPVISSASSLPKEPPEAAHAKKIASTNVPVDCFLPIKELIFIWWFSRSLRLKQSRLRGPAIAFMHPRDVLRS